ncbi:MAG: 4Fe-4S dicluster domain-containing protein [Deferribacteraceae bacterium]|jgi:anaerobic dimethyl sulfoxide reductase subunit B (iron-sulfur subunit)|nr:4Fe-4S dicluster domain-containing protein [Deferribacteraceae bacterium]
MAQYGFYSDSSICSGCKACQVACKDKNNQVFGINYRKPYHVETGGFKVGSKGTVTHNAVVYSLSIACNHCSKPACTEVCPTGAMQKDKATGIVNNDKTKCIGCGNCASACPYNAPTINEELGKSYKCDFCADLVEKGEQPACVAACPLVALDCGEIADLRRKYGKVADVHGLASSKETAPNLVLKLHKGAK